MNWIMGFLFFGSLGLMCQDGAMFPFWNVLGLVGFVVFAHLAVKIERR